jgi:hypothetical protein
MLVLALFGGLFFVIGYAMPTGKNWARRIPAPPAEFARKPVKAVALITAGLGIFSFLLFVAQGGGIGDLTVALGGRSEVFYQHTLETPKYLAYGSTLLISPALLLFALNRQRHTVGMFVLVAFLIAVATLVHGSSGARYALLPLFGGILVFWFVSRGKRPGIASSVLVIALALTVSAALQYGRTGQYQSQGASPTAGADYVTGVREAVTSPAAPLEPITKGEDAGMAPWLAASMTVIPDQMRFGFGRYLAVDLFTRWIPRQIWPEKPEPTHTQVTNRIVPNSLNVTVHPAYSVLMHAYLDFGMFGALWLLGYGILFRALFEWFRIHSDSVPAMLIFSLGLLMMVDALRDNPVDVLILITFLFAPIAVSVFLTRRTTAAAG